MSKTRVAIVGLGMAVTPHAKSYLDLADRAEVAYAFSPSEGRRRSFAERFDFAHCESLATILGDPSVDAVTVLTPPTRTSTSPPPAPEPASMCCSKNRSRCRPSGPNTW